MATGSRPFELRDNDADILAHLGDDYERYEGAVIQPIFMNSLHVTPKDQMDSSVPRRFAYGRVSNPTVDLFERKIAALERGDKALAFASGMAAISSAMLACVKAGDHIVCVENAYGPTRVFIDEFLVGKFGCEATYVDGRELSDFIDNVKPSTSLIYLESPVSMLFKLQDLRAVADFARPRGIRTIVDNSWATPLYQKPLAMGIDLSVHTVSKYIAGHSDVIAGVCVGGESIMKDVHRVREFYGGILQPMEAWLCIRGLRSLGVRLKAHESAALEIAKRLEQHPAVKTVNHPGLDSFPQRELARRQMTGTTSPLSFELNCANADARGFVKRLEWFNVGPSWGGFESMAVVSGGEDSLVRIHVGLEDIETLWDDLKRSLDQI
ncbi:MAG: PLP-dependent aspartate aminotransferase family protein [Oscillospiraceae bacterium]|jgi:cystathionine gamma-lyase|nr:PLP-dependent aspartate aminotransferase family protein [Oscillospiraceae bacterium]